VSVDERPGPAAGWRPDPYGRFAQRWHDGDAWTEHVVAGDGVQQVDPMGRSSVIPFALPGTATGTGTPWPPPDPATRRR